MGVACQIIIDKKKEGVYKAGETVAGVVKFAFDKAVLYKTVTLSLLGTGNCSWRESESNNQSTTYSGSEEYVTIHKNLLNPKTRTACFEIGSYAYRFQFQLPENIPSSFKNGNCIITYKVQMKFEKPEFFSFSKTFDSEILVYGYVEPKSEGPVTFGLEKTLMNLFSNEKPMINLRAKIDKTGLQPGENADLSLIVTNNTDVVPTVQTELFCVTTYKANCGRTNTTHTQLKKCSSEKTDIPKRSVVNISQTVPVSPESYTIISKVLERVYKLKVTVRLPMPHMNAVVEMPVVIGERKGVNVDESVVTLGDELNEDLEIGQEVIGDEPPSYWEVMCEDKIKDE